MESSFAREAKRMPGLSALWQCSFSRDCKDEPTTDRNGELHAMCKAHRRQDRMSKKHRHSFNSSAPGLHHDHASDVGIYNAPAAPSSEATITSTPHHPENLCKHPSRCVEARAIKKNGGLHWLCEKHRQLQNAAQCQRYQRQKVFANSRNTTKQDHQSVDSSSTTPRDSQSYKSQYRASYNIPNDEAVVPTVAQSGTLEKQQCGHRSICHRARALKNNGELHWLCDHHREQQNAIQRKRRRQLSAARRMLKLTSEITSTQDTNSSKSATQVCNRAGRTAYFTEQFSVHPSKRDASSSESDHTAVISEPLLSILKAHHDEVARRIQVDQLFLKNIEDLWAAFDATN